MENRVQQLWNHRKFLVRSKSMWTKANMTTGAALSMLRRLFYDNDHS